ncbi:glycoprotease family protein (macronuclear) [Tetrahymena thermophila SB210]|uniref:dual-specificity kinase n=1 Tax=Tetrahymena thermophila (strain SB210) TaxID=312017 RepID=I7M6M9_TETTS|nr:glycoprotease family protein [Tetrahymena thermophila SB210]EAR85505.3 glycoprotease family protein [Tetrahymena thermophila SB210]|eukprot:XP_001033168.3 glycoprotease family protein [Tetrahymena thermophila SB210]
MRSSSNGNGYRPHYHKKLLISPKNISFDVNDSQISKPQWTTKSEDQQKNTFSFQQNNLYNASTAICTVQSHSTKAQNITLNNSNISGYLATNSSSQQRYVNNTFDTQSSTKNATVPKKVYIINKQQQSQNANSNNTTPKSTAKQRFNLSNQNGLYDQTRKRIKSTQNNTNMHNNSSANNSFNNEQALLSTVDLASQDISAQNSRFSSGPSPKSKNFVPITAKNASNQQAIVMNAIKSKIQNIFQQQQQQRQQPQQLQQSTVLQPSIDIQQYKQPNQKKRDLVLTLKKSTENLADSFINSCNITQNGSTKSSYVRNNKITQENIAPQQAQNNEPSYDEEYISDAKFISQINRTKKPPQPKKGATVPTNQSINNLQSAQQELQLNYNNNNIKNGKKISRYGEEYSKRQSFQMNGGKQMYCHNEQLQIDKCETINIPSHIYSKSTNHSASKGTKSPFQINPTPTNSNNNNSKKPKLSLNSVHLNNRASSFSVEDENQVKFMKNVESFTNQQQTKLKSLRQILNDTTDQRQNTHASVISTNNDQLILNTENTNNILTQSKENLNIDINSEIKDWALVNTPLTPEETIQKYANYLTDYEKTEIKLFQQIYFIGHQCKKKFQKTSQFNNGFDDSRGEYQLNLLDHIAYRYELLECLGKGSFGSVVKVFDHKRKEFLALKVIRNKKKFHNQALIELNILSYIKEQDKDEATNIVRIKDFVIFRKHVCLVFELLSINLYDLLRNNKYQGLSLELIRRFAIQILNSINFLRKNRIIHCDLKPENILLKQANKSGVKLIDFGSSCFENERLYTYIQSRYYRAPEVILGLPYDTSIDMWSFGCIMAELFIGYPIFPGEDEQEQIGYIWEIIGAPSKDFLQNCTRRKYFFNEDYTPKLIPNSKGKIRVPNSKILKAVLQTESEDFTDFLTKCFVWEPQKRLKPSDALMHPWILEGLPPEIRIQHIKYIQSQVEIDRLTQEQQQYDKQNNNSMTSSMPSTNLPESKNTETSTIQSSQIGIKENMLKSDLKEFNQFGIPQNLNVQSSKNASEKNKNNMYIPSPVNSSANQQKIQIKAESTKHSYDPNQGNNIEKQLYFISQKRKQHQNNQQNIKID